MSAPKISKQRTRRVTRLLALGFVAVAALHLLAFVLAFTAYRDARAMLDDFRINKAPTSLLLREISTEARVLAEDVDDIPLQNNSQALAELKDRFRKHTASLVRMTDRADTVFAGIRSGYETTDGAILHSLRAQTTLLEQRAHAKASQEIMLKQLEALRLKATRASYVTTSPDVHRQLLRNLGSGWSSYLLLLPDVRTSQDLARVQNSLRGELQQAARLIGRLPQHPAIEPIAADLIDILTAIDAEAGPFADQSKLLRRLSNAAQLANEASQSVRSFNELVSNTQTNYASDTGSLLNISAEAIERAERIFIALAALSLLVSGLLIWQVVHRGVSRPLAQLASRTQRIAGGDYREDGRERLSSRPYLEFTQIETALEVFEQNALTLKATQNELEQSNLDLRDTVSDLERFSYAVSHDMRSPLRGIQTLVGFAREDFGDETPGGLTARLDQIEARAQQLEQLLVGLLDYAHAGRREFAHTDIDVSTMVTELSALLDATDGTVEIALAVDTVIGPEPVISQILRNLIDNALKHANVPDKAPKILVSNELDGDFVLLRVDDNGPGIEHEYRNRVVKLFETLKPKSSGGGSGMGLSLIRKLLERYGGDISLDDSPLGGLRVTVRWPANPSAKPSYLAADQEQIAG